MSLLNEYLCGATELRMLQRDIRDRVMWAAEPFEEGETVKARICRAANELRRSVTVIRDAWYEDIGPYQYADLYNAWLDLQKRRAEKHGLGWTVYVNEKPIEPLTKAQVHLARTIAGLRRTG